MFLFLSLLSLSLGITCVPPFSPIVGSDNACLANWSTAGTSDALSSPLSLTLPRGAVYLVQLPLGAATQAYAGALSLGVLSNNSQIFVGTLAEEHLPILLGRPGSYSYVSLAPQPPATTAVPFPFSLSLSDVCLSSDEAGTPGTCGTGAGACAEFQDHLLAISYGEAFGGGGANGNAAGELTDPAVEVRMSLSFSPGDCSLACGSTPTPACVDSYGVDRLGFQDALIVPLTTTDKVPLSVNLSWSCPTADPTCAYSAFFLTGTGVDALCAGQTFNLEAGNVPCATCASPLAYEGPSLGLDADKAWYLAVLPKTSNGRLVYAVGDVGAPACVPGPSRLQALVDVAPPPPPGPPTTPAAPTPASPPTAGGPAASPPPAATPTLPPSPCLPSCVEYCGDAGVTVCTCDPAVPTTVRTFGCAPPQQKADDAGSGSGSVSRSATLLGLAWLSSTLA